MFSEIKGHSAQLKAIIGNVKNNRLPSAYLFSGPSGIGKKLAALNFAKFINCEKLSEEKQDSCGTCPTCKKIDKLEHPDIFLVAAEASREERLGFPEPDLESRSAKNQTSRAIKIEQIKEVGKRVVFRPYEARYKIFIIDEAENMTQEASDAFLKTLEEPPQDTIFILISANEKMLPATIVSRCRRIKFNGLSLQMMKEILTQDYLLDKNKAHFLSCFLQGRLAEALRVKDKDIIDDKNAIIDNFLNKRIDFKNRLDAQYKLNLFLGWLRDLLLIKIRSHYTLINIDREPYLIKNRDRYTVAELRNYISFISEALSYLDRNINIRLLNNLARIKLCKA